MSMNREQAITYLRSSGLSEEQIQTVIDAFEMPEEAKDRQENTIDKILTLIDAEAWGYCDYLLKQGIGGNADRHASAVTSNIRERLMEELPGILSDEYEKAFMEGFESHPTHKVYQKAFEDIRAEIKGEMTNKVELSKNRALYWVLELIDHHDPSKAGKENG